MATTPGSTKQGFRCSFWVPALLILSVHIGHQASAVAQLTGRVVESDQDKYSSTVQGPATRFDEAIKLFGISQEELRYSSPDLFECLRAYLDLKRQHALESFDRVDRDRVKEVLRTTLARNPKILAAFAVAGRDGGFVFSRGKAGLYRQIATAGDLVAGIAVRGREPSVFDVPMNSDPEDEEYNDYWLLWQDANKNVRLRKYCFSEESESRTTFFSCDDYSPIFVNGAWPDYLARRPVLLRLTAEDQKTDLRSLYNMLASKCLCEQIRGTVLAEVTDSDDVAKDAQNETEMMAKAITEAQIKWMDFTEPTTLPTSEIFILGDYLVLREDNPEDRIFVAEFLPAR